MEEGEGGDSRGTMECQEERRRKAVVEVEWEGDEVLWKASNGHHSVDHPLVSGVVVFPEMTRRWLRSGEVLTVAQSAGRSPAESRPEYWQTL